MTKDRQRKLEENGINITETLDRLGNMEIVDRILELFLKDDCFKNLVKAIDEENVKDAYVYAHTLKGLSANLSIKKLNEYATNQSDYFKKGDFEAGKSLMPQVKEEYEKAFDAIKG